MTAPSSRSPRSLFGEAVLLVFLIAQVCDGVFTYVGVRTFGASIEANPIVAWYIAGLGVGTALIAVKGLAFSCAALLYFFACHRTLQFRGRAEKSVPVARNATLRLGLALGYYPP